MPRHVRSSLVVSLLVCVFGGLLLPTAFAQDSTAAAEEAGWQDTVNDAFGTLNGWISSVFFAPVPIPGTDDGSGKPVGVPFTVLWLIFGATFFTLRMGFINVRGFGHALAVVRGKYDSPEDAGEVSSFQALTTALSATVGLGNIAGVAIAVSVGGPGAIFWDDHGGGPRHVVQIHRVFARSNVSRTTTRWSLDGWSDALSLARPR